MPNKTQTTNMRKKQSWMEKGATVALSYGTGTITNVIECRMGGNGPKYLGEPMVMKIYVQPEGVKHSWPMNPHEVEPLLLVKKAS